jgi:hypothetical protein
VLGGATRATMTECEYKLKLEKLKACIKSNLDLKGAAKMNLKKTDAAVAVFRKENAAKLAREAQQRAEAERYYKEFMAAAKKRARDYESLDDMNKRIDKRSKGHQQRLHDIRNNKEVDDE